MIRAWQDNRGMSLLEMIIALFVLSLVSGAIYSSFSAGLKAYWKGDINTQVQQGARLAIDQMSRDIRQGRRLIPATIDVVSGFQFDNKCAPSAPQISFEVPEITTVTLNDGSSIYGTYVASSGGLQAGTYVSYYLAAGQTGVAALTPNTSGPYLMKHVELLNPGGPQAWTRTAASNVTGLAFADAQGGGCPTTNTRGIQVTLTASQQAVGQGVSSADVVSTNSLLRTKYP